MKSRNTGFIKIFLLVIGILVVLKYAYKIDVVGFLTTGNFKIWLDKFYNLALSGWEKYGEVVTKIWNYILNFCKGFLTKN